MKYGNTLLILLILFGLTACKPDNPKDSTPSSETTTTEHTLAPEDAPTGNAEREHYYSPFLLTAEDAPVFKTITFTDVGLKQPEPGPVDPLLLETIAESLADRIAHHEKLDFTPAVQYDKDLIDPSNHLFCEEHHLYIALWRGYAPDRWGYSLWSGCNEEHQFAWKEILESEPDDLVASVEPLTQSIADTLAEATERDCFLSHC